jgi:hypothetical protein
VDNLSIGSEKSVNNIANVITPSHEQSRESHDQHPNIKLLKTEDMNYTFNNLNNLMVIQEEYDSFRYDESIDKDTISFESILQILTLMGMIDIQTNVQDII